MTWQNGCDIVTVDVVGILMVLSLQPVSRRRSAASHGAFWQKAGRRMEQKTTVPDCPVVAWEAIYKIAKNGDDAVVKMRNGEIHVVAVSRKIKAKAKIQ